MGEVQAKHARAVERHVTHGGDDCGTIGEEWMTGTQLARNG